MKIQDQYRIWKAGHSTIDVNTDFSASVMDRICTFEEQQGGAASVPSPFLSWLNAHPLAQAAAITLTMVIALAEGALLLRIGIG